MLVVATKNVNNYNNNNNNNNNKVVLLFVNLTECSEIHRTLSLVMSRTNPCQICMSGFFTVLGALFSVKKDANRKDSTSYLSYLLRVNLNSGKSDIFSTIDYWSLWTGYHKTMRAQVYGSRPGQTASSGSGQKIGSL